MSEQQGDPQIALVELYDAALPHVYGYLLSRRRRQQLGGPHGRGLPRRRRRGAATGPADGIAARLIGTARHTAGGDAGGVQTRSYGLEALCADDQGVRFYLGELLSS